MKKSVALESGVSLPKKKPLFKEFKKHYALLIMLIPGFIALCLFAYKPMIGLVTAFKDYRIRRGVWASPWAAHNGMGNFIELFNSENFLRILKNTIVISFLRLLFGFPGPIILALLLNEMRGKVYKRIVQTLTYLPHFFSWVVLGGIIKMIFAPVGPVNMVLQNIGFSEPVPFLGENGAFMGLLVGTAVWQGLGWGAIIYMAALSGVDESLYEAAYIDGASRWRQVWAISIPSIMGTVTTVFIMNLGQVLNAGFDQIFNMYNQSVYEVSEIIDTYSYKLLSSQDYDLGTALGLFKSLVGLVFVLASNWLVKVISKDEYGIL